LSKFDDRNLSGANKEVQDLIEVAQFTALEKQKFLSQVNKELKNHGVILDFLRN